MYAQPMPPYAPSNIHPGASYPIQTESMWKTRDVWLAVACAVSLIAQAVVIGLALSPVGAAPAFIAFYKVFAMWSQLSNIALGAIALITIVHRNCTNYPRFQSALNHLVL